MPEFAYGNFAFGMSLADVIQQSIIVQARLSDYEHLAPGDTDTQNNILAQIVNRAIDEWLTALPGIGVASEAITFTGGTNEYPIPETMLGRQIVEIRYSSSVVNQGAQKRPIQFMGQFGKANLPAWVLIGQQQLGFPSYCTLDDTAQNIQFWPFPASGYVVDVKYQQAPHEITGAEVADPAPDPGDPVIIGELPTLWLNAFAARVGAEVLQSLDAGAAAGLYTFASTFLERQVIKRLTQLQAADQPYQQGAGGFAANPLYATQFNNFVR